MLAPCKSAVTDGSWGWPGWLEPAAAAAWETGAAADGSGWAGVSVGVGPAGGVGSGKRLADSDTAPA